MSERRGSGILPTGSHRRGRITQSIFRSTSLLLTVTLAVVHQATADAPTFVHLAEGYTASDTASGIVAAQRMFSAPDFDEICAPLEPPDRLVSTMSAPPRLIRGQWFAYDTLAVVAVDAAGKSLPPVPIVLEVEERTPELLNLRSDMTADGKVVPIRAGHFRFRLSTLCGAHRVSVTIDAEVVDP